VDITPYLAPGGFQIELATDTDNGSASITLISLPGSVDEGLRIYVYGDGTLLFNGFLPDGGTAWNEDGAVTLSCVDACSSSGRTTAGLTARMAR
jgi:hypothetical protein